MNMNLLIVDDNQADRTLLRRYMSRPGNVVNIKEAQTADEGLAILKGKESIDCVFLDFRLPDRDGISLLKEVYDKETDLGPFPVVMLTGQGSEAVMIDAIRYGAQDYLIKNNMSPDTLYIALTKAREIYYLKKKGSEDKALLVHSQKMKAVGQLTGGIAHDFNNLLTIIYGNTRLLEALLNSPKPKAKECLSRVDVIQKAARRGDELVKRLMLFSRHRPLEPQTVNINRLIAEIEQLLRHTLGSFVEIKLRPSQSVDSINVDPGQLEHAVVNMAVNARDAMLDGGVLTITTHNVVLGEQQGAELGLKEGDYVVLSLADTGLGMTDEVRRRIFEPFFSTKEPGKGTGLGLSMVYDFVKQSGGGLSVESERHKGTTFNLFFPASSHATVLRSEEDKNGYLAVEGGNETILVVEDEEEIRFLARVMLEEKGYHVMEASNGQEALDMALTERRKIDMLFTDVTMPGELNGLQAAARIQVLRPDIKLVFATGYLAESMPDMDLVKRYPVINKPYQPENMLRTIRKTLDN